MMEIYIRCYRIFAGSYGVPIGIDLSVYLDFWEQRAFHSPAVNLMMVTHLGSPSARNSDADISEEEKKLIAGDNLRRLLGNVKENPLCKR